MPSVKVSTAAAAAETVARASEPAVEAGMCCLAAVRSPFCFSVYMTGQPLCRVLHAAAPAGGAGRGGPARAVPRKRGRNAVKA